ncbi:rCG47006 [Rattus norvegicus]|uniref:RCG47006 n=1 Tax=Rattus norvegicus TaxID=10116 RepID=A6K4Y5_RAT|nr:rCG47006 [Rattus norvegicus]
MKDDKMMCKYSRRLLKNHTNKKEGLMLVCQCE